MKINFTKFLKVYEINNKKRLGFVLTSENGAVLNLGIKKNFTKYNGYYYYDIDEKEYYKVLDEILLELDREIVRIEEKDVMIRKVYDSIYEDVKRVPLNEVENKEYNNNSLGEVDKAKYDNNSKVDGDVIGVSYGDNGEIEELVKPKTTVNPEESYFVGLSGGIWYNVNNFYGYANIDLDVRKENDFDEWGRIYNVYREKDLIIVEYKKEKDNKEEYKIYAVFKIPNTEVELKKEWIKKEYSYDKERKSLFTRYVFRVARFKIVDYKNVFIGVGKTKEEAVLQTKLLEKHYDEMISLKKRFNETLVSPKDFENLISEENYLAYYLAFKNYYSFLVKDFNNIYSHFNAGYPWFLQNWSRDTLVSLRPLINSGEYSIVKKILYNYFDKIDENTGLLPVFDNAKNYSLDSVFWLTRRFFDLFFKLAEKKKLEKYFPDKELEVIYNKLNLIFNKVIMNKWDKEKELIKVGWAETWMDTIEREYPLEIQVMFLGLLSDLAVLSNYLGKKDKEEHFENLEFLMRANIREKYFRDGMLYDEPYKNKITNNIFLAYYFYPDLLFEEDWKRVFDKAVYHLWLDWGGFSSLSKKDSNFKDTYSGEDNSSYHNGDSWIYINNIAALVLYDFDKKEYKEYIDKIISRNKEDLFKRGFIGYISEVSSAKEFEPSGCLGQLWSHATFIELLDKIHGRK